MVLTSPEAMRNNDSGRACGAATTALWVVTVSSSMRPELRRLDASVRRVGAALDVLGLGEPWRGLGSKISLLSGYLDNDRHEIADDDLMLFVDAYDVLLLPAAINIRASWAVFESESPGRIIFNAESNCAPDPSLMLAYPPRNLKKPFPFLNSGVYLGRVQDVRNMVADVHADITHHHVAFGADPYRFDDQRWFHRFGLASPNRVHVDVTASFFHTLHNINIENFDSGPGRTLVSKMSGTAPMALHGNGNGMDTFHALTRALQDEVGWPVAQGSFATTTSSALAI